MTKKTSAIEITHFLKFMTRNWQLLRDKKMDSQIFSKRARILDLMREWFQKEGFLEVETPLMVRYPGMEPDLDVFTTEFVSKEGSLREKRYFHTSPEYAMKKLLGAGFQKIFQITKAFRNGEFFGSPTSRMTHNPEFTMIEWYRANADYQEIMKDTEDMIRHVANRLPVPRPLQHVLSQAFEKLSIRDAFLRYADLNLDGLRDLEKFQKAVKKKKYKLTTEYSWDDLFFLVMLNEVEPKLKNPVFLYDYPASQAALSKKKADDPFWAERFELYINGLELCNAFTELNDPVEQRSRLVLEQELRRQMGKEVFSLDEDFLEALSTMPPSGGNALGIDRLVMVLLEKKSIEEILLFPFGD